MSDDRLIASLEAAVASAPEDGALRLHLARLQLDNGDAARALDHAAEVLRSDPANLDALGVAARAARACGRDEQAQGYERLIAALDPDAGAEDHRARADRPSEAQPAPLLAETGPPPRAIDDIDEFLRELVEEAEADIERPEVTLADVGGLEHVKRRLEVSFLAPMRNPKVRKAYGKTLRGGLLLYGPPGCGKTFLARAVAGELHARFFSVGLHDVLDMWLGKSEQNLHNIFETARRHTPCVLFLDEVDALGMKRSNLAHSAGRNVVVQLLSELDSTRNDNEGIFVLGATNQPWDIDPALRRPGRFYRTLLVLPPDQDARAAIVEYHLRDRPVAGVDVQSVARKTEGFSGADLRLLCEAATERAMEASLESGDVRPVGATDFDAALREVSASTRPWFEAAKSYAMFSNQTGAYDDLLSYMRKHRLA